MGRTSFYVDGFNLYHVLDRFCPECKWLDLRRVLRSVIPASESISDLYYFSALAHWKPERVFRHRAYIDALKASGVAVVLGRFKDKERRCRLCQKSYVAHEEKRTDVNVALRMLEDAMDDRYDTAILVSGDTDFVPVLAAIKRRFPEKRVGVMAPLGSRATELKMVADFFIKMKRHHLKANQFPDVVETPQKRIVKPEQWK